MLTGVVAGAVLGTTVFTAILALALLGADRRSDAAERASYARLFGSSSGAAEILASLTGWRPRRPWPTIPDDLGQVLGIARTLFASEEEQRRWLARPHPELGGMAPVVAALQPDGAARVRDLVASRAEG